jgi:hypothetical protein
MKFPSNRITLIICSFILLNFPQFVNAQIDSTNLLKNRIWNNLSIQASYQNGYVFGTNDFIKGNNAFSDTINDFQALSFRFSKQTVGKKLWEQLYKYPEYGIGLYLGDFQNPVEIGYPFGIYGFFNAPFKRWKEFTFTYEIGFGATFNWKKYDPISNKYNISIGAGKSFLIDAGMSMQYFLTRNLRVEGGFSLTHFSNGALKIPNEGINTIAPRLSVKYCFSEQPEFIENKVPKYSPNNEWLFIVFGGAKNVIFDSVDVNIVEKYEGLNYPVFGVSMTFNRQVSYKSKIGLGMSVSYNGTYNAQVAVDNNELEPVYGTFGNKLQLSIFPSYEIVAHKVSLLLQPAFYLYRKKTKNQSPIFYQKFGLKYHITDRFFLGMTLRAYKFHVSDFIEWNIGYRIN